MESQSRIKIKVRNAASGVSGCLGVTGEQGWI